MSVFISVSGCLLIYLQYVKAKLKVCLMLENFDLIKFLVKRIISPVTMNEKDHLSVQINHNAAYIMYRLFR